MLQGKSGFSLIELMVVIAIVAVLAAVALPSYKEYMLKANLTKFYIMAGHLIQKDIEYYTVNGAWADLVNLAPAYVGYFERNPVDISDLLTSIEVDNGDASAACNYSSIHFSLDSSKFGNAFDDSDPDTNKIIYTFGKTPSGTIIIGCEALSTNSQNLIDAITANCTMTSQDVLDITCP